MVFKKYTAPPPPPPKPPKPKPHIKFVRTIIHFTEDGLKHLGEIAAELKDATHVYLWHDDETNQIAITPAPASDSDAFPVKDGKIQAKKFLESVNISVPVKEHGKFVAAHDDGVKITVGAPPKSGSKPSADVTPIPKKKKWEPGDPIPTRGRKSAAQLAWLAEQEKKGS